MYKIFNTGSLICLIVSLTGLKFPQTAASLTKNPCDDFYEYACSSYSQTNKEISQTLESKLNEKLLNFLNSEVEKRRTYNSNRIDSKTYFNKIVTYFEACLKQQPDFSVYLQPFTDLMINNTDIWLILGKMQSYGLNNVMINYKIKRNKNNSLNITLAPEKISDAMTLKPDDNMLMGILEWFGYKTNEAKQQWFFNDSKWREILNNYRSSAKSKRKVTLRRFSSLYPKLQIYLKNLLEADFDNIAFISIHNLEFFEFLQENELNTEVALKMLIIKYLYYLHEDSTKDFAPFDCLQDLRNKFDLGLNFIYYNKIFKSNDRNSLLYTLALPSMYRNIQNVMSKQLMYNNLRLTGRQIKYLQTKLEAVKINIGNLPLNATNDDMNSFYQDIPSLDRNNYFANHLLVLKHRFRSSIMYTENATYSPGIDSNTATTPCLPFYVPDKNMIVIPIASFEQPLFYHQQSLLKQLAIFGFIIAHELTHAIDNWGLLYDHEGVKLSNRPNILEHDNFKASVNCMKQQEHTEYVHERIADQFAIRVVYYTYWEYHAQRQDTWSKEFFEHLALFFCGDNNVQYMYHDSDAVRLQQIVKNFPPFAMTYNCAQNSAMNMKLNCRLY